MATVGPRSGQKLTKNDQKRHENDANQHETDAKRRKTMRKRREMTRTVPSSWAHRHPQLFSPAGGPLKWNVSSYGFPLTDQES